jgi:hypothetical protein
MSERDRRLHEYRLRLEQEARDDDERQDDEAEAEKRRSLRAQHRGRWVEAQVQAAIDRGEFDDLEYAGRPIPALQQPYDPDWWIKRLAEREDVSGAMPPALALRKEDAVLVETLDALTTEKAVRAHLDDFNARVRDARRQLLGGPPVITPLRDVDAEVAAWHERRAARRRAREAVVTPPPPARRRWWRRARPAGPR